MSFVPEEISLIVSSDPAAGAINKTNDGSYFEIQLDGEGIHLPKDAINVNVAVEEATVWWTIPNIITGVNDLIRITGENDQGGTGTFNIILPQGLYDLSGLNQAIITGLENAGALTVDGNGNSISLISLEADDATQKVRIRFNTAQAAIYFNIGQTPREILGFESNQYGPFPGSYPTSVLAENTAAFNQVNYFLLHSDLVNKGIRFNNSFNQTIAQILIDVAPGSQIISKPFNPAKCNGQELAGSRRTNLRFWITDDKQRPVNTNGEYFTARIVIHYMRPMIIGRTR